MRRWPHQTTPGTLPPSLPLSGLVGGVPKYQASQVTHWHLSRSHSCFCVLTRMASSNSSCCSWLWGSHLIAWSVKLDACRGSLAYASLAWIHQEKERQRDSWGRGEESVYKKEPKCRVWHGHQSKLRSGLPSLLRAPTDAASGWMEQSSRFFIPTGSTTAADHHTDPFCNNTSGPVAGLVPVALHLPLPKCSTKYSQNALQHQVGHTAPGTSQLPTLLLIFEVHRE